MSIFPVQTGINPDFFSFFGGVIYVIYCLCWMRAFFKFWIPSYKTWPRTFVVLRVVPLPSKSHHQEFSFTLYIITIVRTKLSFATITTEKGTTQVILKNNLVGIGLFSSTISWWSYWNISAIHPGKLTWNVVIPPWKSRNNIYQPPIVGFHVSSSGVAFFWNASGLRELNATKTDDD